MSRFTTFAAVVMYGIILLGGSALGSNDARGQMPFYFLDWDEVAAADVPPVVSLLPNADGTCAGHIESNITIGPKESGTKRLTLAPVALRQCVFEVRAEAAEGVEATAQELQTSVSSQASDLGCWADSTLCEHEATNQAELMTNAAGAPDEQDVRATFCRIADGWAHTGVPDPPTVIYTRVYQEMQFCYDSSNAWVDQVNGVCFANSGSDWSTDPDECYFSDWDTGPSPEVFLTIHGYFEKTGSSAYHDMWNTVHGEAGSGSVWCTGEIVGEYDGYVSVANCGATNPEQQE